MFKGGRSNIKRNFWRNTDGNFGVMASLTLLGLISGIGLSVDTQRFFQHGEKAQSVADAAGLSAAIFVGGNNDQAPTIASNGVFLEGQSYSATELGFDLSFGENISFEVDYDDVNREVTVTTTSSMTPLILQLVGKNTIGTTKTSSVRYADPADANAASVLFVLDNSGSMWFDDRAQDTTTGVAPSIAVRRIDSLKQNVNRLNQQFRNIGGDTQTAGQRFLRTGLLTYNSGTLTQRILVGFNKFGQSIFRDIVVVPEEGAAGAVKTEIPMNWRTIAPGTANQLSSVGTQATNVHGMFPYGGTNSAPAMARALQIMTTGTNNEKRVHELEGNMNASRFVVFMSDGQNDDTGTNTWVADPFSEFWRRLETVRRCFNIGFGRWCFNVQEWVFWDFDIEGREPTGSGWEEGRFVTAEDAATRANCDALKSDGVTVYTIGFALEAGTYDTNDWHDTIGTTVPGGGNQPNQVSAITEADKLTRAVSLMQNCATDPSTFLLADNAAQLDIAFQQIGQAILADIVRLTN